MHINDLALGVEEEEGGYATGVERVEDLGSATDVGDLSALAVLHSLSLFGGVVPDFGGDDLEVSVVFFSNLFHGRTGRTARGSSFAEEVDKGGLSLEVGVGEGGSVGGLDGELGELLTHDG